MQATKKLLVLPNNIVLLAVQVKLAVGQAEGKVAGCQIEPQGQGGMMPQELESGSCFLVKNCLDLLALDEMFSGALGRLGMRLVAPCSQALKQRGLSHFNQKCPPDWFC